MIRFCDVELLFIIIHLALFGVLSSSKNGLSVLLRFYFSVSNSSATGIGRLDCQHLIYVHVTAFH